MITRNAPSEQPTRILHITIREVAGGLGWRHTVVTAGRSMHRKDDWEIEMRPSGT
ncbi:hypothetical protein BDN67DRAFT_974188 [Paxillus ammoniavirescens]|nr:hypothetical protein BDN67DRAFT_974188 [Paxillus ammoniavirescens]